MGTATFLANDDSATCVDSLRGPSPGLPAIGWQVLLITVGLVLREGVVQASVGTRVTRTLTGVALCQYQQVIVLRRRRL